MALRAADARAAEREFRRALALERDPYTLAALADLLLDGRRAPEVVELLRGCTADGLLLRLVEAEAAVGAPALSDHLGVLRDRFASARSRGDTVHLREEARFALRLEHDAARAVRLARENWSMQREPADARLFVEAARAAGDPGAAASFLRAGVAHIFSGIDHVLFLLALLLPAVLRRERDGWRPIETFRPALRETLFVVSAFTAAHSITLGLAALKLVQLPSRWVESIIALSVLLAALNNLVPLFRGRQWAFAFAFGLLHGFGFAGALVDLGLPATRPAGALVAFNLGVETGQLAIVAAALSLAYAVRRTRAYPRLGLAAGSAAIAVLAATWVVERALQIDLSFI